jgi:hypothetical protein
MPAGRADAASAGPHRVRYTGLTSDEEEFHGLVPNGQATSVSLVKLSDVPSIITLTEADLSREEA